jgi:RHS repeat-associated protein
VPDGTSLANRTYYSPYGEIRNLLLPPPTERGWLGKTKDPTTGLNALGARYYDATLGRFLSTDPASDGSSAQAANAYSYAANNPITYMDPTGLWSLSGAWNAVKSGVSKAADWVDENKGLLTNIAVGIGVGIAVGALCATGVGCVVAAGVAAGAAGAAACYGVDVAEGKKDFSWGGLATEVGIGAASGVAGVGVGKVIGTAGKLAGTAAGKAVTGAVNRTGTAVANAVRSPGARAAAVGAKVPAGGAKVANASDAFGDRHLLGHLPGLPDRIAECGRADHWSEDRGVAKIVAC